MKWTLYGAPKFDNVLFYNNINFKFKMELFLINLNLSILD